jgi:outer membrane protein assembly factor BamA
MNSSINIYALRSGYWILLACLLTSIEVAVAQNPVETSQTIPTALQAPLEYEPGAYAIVEDIVIEGNRKTRRPIVLREMSLRAGDTLWLDQLEETLDNQRRLLLNTNLFADVEVLVSTLDLEHKETILRAVVRERWYVYPAFDIDLADRNFNVWWTEGNRSLGRINYELKLRHGNLTGRRDKLTFRFQVGYTRKYELKYELPYIDKAQILGLELGVLVDQNREWNTSTEDGRLQFYRSDTSNVLQRERYRVGLVLRPKIETYHSLRLERQYNRIDRTLAESVNPNFFGDERRKQQFFGLQYRLVNDKRDVRNFPLNGNRTTFIVEKLGFRSKGDLNRTNVSLQYDHFQPLGGKLFNLMTVAKVKTDLQRTQVPFFNRESLGFNANFVRGYQYYVVDGLDYAFLKNTLRAKVLETRIRLPFVPYKRFSDVPMRLYLGPHADVGAMHDPFETEGNVLANRLLTSYGVGAYAVLWYGKVIHFEVTRNDLAEWGGYFGFSLEF